MIFNFRNTSAIMSSYLLVYASPDAKCPCGARRYWYRPNSVIKVVSLILSSSSNT